MNRYSTLLVVLSGLCFTDTLLTAAERPNIVLILADDLGWSDAGCYGHKWQRTPTIDRLAAEGMRFTNAYSSAPICSAARASLLTGKAVARLGFEFVTKNKPGYQQLDVMQSLQAPPLTLNLPLDETTIAEALLNLDYETAFFGKWHVSQHHEGYLGWHPKFGPAQQGFEVAIENFGDHPYAWKRAHGRQPVLKTPPKEFADDGMVQLVADFIRSPHERPFFVMASSFYVHTPVKNRCRWLVDQYDTVVPQGIPRRKARLEYAAFVQTLDHHVGKILAAIDESRQRDNTLVLFMSDNGGHPEFTGNAPLRGSKWNLYEGGIRVPLIARWPSRIAANSMSETPVIGYDLLPTIVSAAGGAANGCDGVSFLPAFADQGWTVDRSLIWHFPYYHPEANFSQVMERIGVDDFAVSQTRPQSAIRRGKHKAIWFAERDRLELYDLTTDISEQNDLSQSAQQLASQLRSELTRQLHEMKARHAVPRTE